MVANPQRMGWGREAVNVTLYFLEGIIKPRRLQQIPDISASSVPLGVLDKLQTGTTVTEEGRRHQCGSVYAIPTLHTLRQRQEDQGFGNSLCYITSDCLKEAEGGGVRKEEQWRGGTEL